MTHGGQLPLPSSKYIKGQKQVDEVDNLWEGLENNADGEQCNINNISIQNCHFFIANPSDLWLTQGKKKYDKRK